MMMTTRTATTTTATQNQWRLITLSPEEHRVGIVVGDD